MFKRHGGCKSNAVAEGYIDDSSSNKRKISQIITSSIILQPLTANSSLKNQLSSLKPIKNEEVNSGTSTSKYSACGVVIEEKVESSRTIPILLQKICHYNCPMCIISISASILINL